MTRKQIYTYGGIALGLTALGMAYYFLVWNKATEDQFYEFENNLKATGKDTLDVEPARRLSLMKMWHKNLNRKQANRLIALSIKSNQSMSAGEVLEFSRLVSIWQERPIKS